MVTSMLPQIFNGTLREHYVLLFGMRGWGLSLVPGARLAWPQKMRCRKAGWAWIEISPRSCKRWILSRSRSNGCRKVSASRHDSCPSGLDWLLLQSRRALPEL